MLYLKSIITFEVTEMRSKLVEPNNQTIQNSPFPDLSDIELACTVLFLIMKMYDKDLIDSKGRYQIDINPKNNDKSFFRELALHKTTKNHTLFNQAITYLLKTFYIIRNHGSAFLIFKWFKDHFNEVTNLEISKRLVEYKNNGNFRKYVEYVHTKLSPEIIEEINKRITLFANKKIEFTRLFETINPDPTVSTNLTSQSNSPPSTDTSENYALLPNEFWIIFTLGILQKKKNKFQNHYLNELSEIVAYLLKTCTIKDTKLAGVLVDFLLKTTVDLANVKDLYEEYTSELEKDNNSLISGGIIFNAELCNQITTANIRNFAHIRNYLHHLQGGAGLATVPQSNEITAPSQSIDSTDNPPATTTYSADEISSKKNLRDLANSAAASEENSLKKLRNATYTSTVSEDSSPMNSLL